MASPLRIQLVNGWYHLTARGNERREIHRDSRDYRHFLELSAQWPQRCRIVLAAYVLMPNHYHLLVRTPAANLSAAMQWLNVSYSVWFNRRHQRAGRLLQGRAVGDVRQRARGLGPGPSDGPGAAGGGIDVARDLPGDGRAALRGGKPGGEAVGRSARPRPGAAVRPERDGANVEC